MAAINESSPSITPNITVPTNAFASWRPYFYICYIIFGGLALAINLVILATLIKQKHLLAKWPSVVALAVGNLASALHSFVYGVYRMPLVYLGTIDEPLSSWICMATLIPTCHVLAYSVPPVIQCIIGLERIVAICAFNWYRVHWTPKKTWWAIAVILSITIPASAVPLWYRVFTNHTIVNRECSSPRLIGLDYLFAEIRFAIIVGVASAAFSIGAAIIGRCRMRKLQPTSSSVEYVSQFRRQFKLSWSMLIVAIFDLALVTVPSILTVVNLSFEMPDSAKVSLYSISYCVYSTVNVVVCIVMNSTLKMAVKGMIRIITCKLCFGSSSSVTTSTVQFIQVTQRQAWTENRSSTRRSMKPVV